MQNIFKQSNKKYEQNAQISRQAEKEDTIGTRKERGAIVGNPRSAESGSPVIFASVSGRMWQQPAFVLD